MLLATLVLAVAAGAAGLRPAARTQEAPAHPPSPAPLETLELADPALALELVASEPHIQSPVAITFDEHGRLYVVEMIDYPHDRGRFPGRVSLLEDADGDGYFERATVFADGLPWPSGAFSYDGGLFVAASPDILYLKDTDGDGRADLRRVVYTGFGNTVPEPMPDMVVNGFAWGLDNRIYGATSRNGGQVSAPGLARRYDLRGRDFSFDPRTFELRPETGGGQFGVTFDDFGRRFVSSNANHLMMAMYEQRYVARNPSADLPRPMLDIPEDGPAAPVFRVSPDEAWRVQRTQWRASGKVRGLVEYGGRPSGYFTSACSLTIYRGDALPPEYYGTAVVAEPANNLVHRKALVPDGIPFKGIRPEREQQTEFLRSTSVWFRPVNFATGPDGALHVVDMHRFIVEDPKTIPDGIVNDEDIRAGSSRGRVYRVVRKGAARRPVPPLADARGEALAAFLTHPNGWVRDTAARLIHERQDMGVVPTVLTLAAEADAPHVRVRALYVLEGLGRLTAAHVRRALEDEDAGVREHAVRLAERFVDDAALRPAVLARVDDPSPRVRYQLAFTLGALPFGDDLFDVFVRLVHRDGGDRWMRAAAATALVHPLVPILEGLTAAVGGRPADGEAAFIGQILRTVGARGRPDEVTAAIEAIDGATDDRLRLRWAGELFAGFVHGDVDVARVDPGRRLAPVLDLARTLARGADADTARRVTAVELLARDPRVDHEVFLEVLTPREPQELQVAAFAALRTREHPAVIDALLTRWAAFTPRLRQEAVGLLAARPSSALRLLEAVRAGTVAVADLSAGQAQSLIAHADPSVAALARELLDFGTSTRQQVVDRYAEALTLEGNPARGREVFVETCAACHRLDGVGVELGPNLLGVRTHGREGLLVDIFDPNRKVDPAYLQYEVERHDGSREFGAIVEETDAAITLVQAFGSRVTIPRREIAALRNETRSLMPEGLETSLTLQQTADLLAYLLDERDRDTP